MRICKYVVAVALAASAGAQGNALLPDISSSSTTVRLETLATGLRGPDPTTALEQIYPVDVAPIPDGSGRFAVATLGGMLRVVQPGGGVDATPLINLWDEPRTEVFAGSYGLTSVAFHPDFNDPAKPGYRKLYTLSTETADPLKGAVPLADVDFDAGFNAFGGKHDDVVYEWTMNASGGVDTTSRREVLRARQPGRDHNMNDLLFRRDGPNGEPYLYIASGDGANASPSTNRVASDYAIELDSFLGKILRIDVDNPAPGKGYAVPADNPFVSDAAALPEIYAYAFRNPYRFNLDEVTGDIWIGEVGQTQVESVDLLQAGGNYGWNVKEGSFLYNKANHADAQPDLDLNNNGIGDVAEANGFIEPVFEYDHTEGQSVVGGFIYRGSDIPELFGKYVFAELGFNRPGVGSRLLYGDTTTGEIFEINIDPLGDDRPFFIFSVGQDLDGELLLLGAPENFSDGVIVRITAIPEPAAGLFLAALAGGLARRRR